jgi:hypothetical protein
MTLELDPAELDLLRKIARSYLSDLRQTIAATQRGTGDMHHEEEILNALLAKVG